MAPLVPVIHASRADRPDEVDTVIAAEAVSASLHRLGYDGRIAALDPELATLARLAARRPYAVFNLVEAIGGDASRSQEVPRALERLGLPFTGAPADAYDVALSKLLTKRRFVAAGLPTPEWWQAGEPVPTGQTVIVKSVSEHASYGMDTASIVPGERAAAEIGAREARFGGRFFAERYVGGREFNVALLDGNRGPEVLPIQEIVFDALPPGRAPIVDYEAKWDESSPAYQLTPRRFGLESSEPPLAARLADLAVRCWHAFGLKGYARVDLRTDAGGDAYILEVNANPCLSPDAGFVATAAHAGLGLDDVVRRILRAAVDGVGTEADRCFAS